MKKELNVFRYTIYKITNIINGKMYIGKHIIKDENDVYFGSGYLLKQAINKYGRINFKMEILEDCLEKEMDQREIFWIDKLNSLIPNGYNINIGGTGGNTLSNNPRKKDICDRISKKLKGIKRGNQSQSHKIKNRDTHLGKRDSDNTKIKKSRCHAKKWVLFLSDGTKISEFDISLKDYCLKNKISYSLLRKYKNNIVPSKKNIKDKRTIGCRLYEVTF